MLEFSPLILLAAASEGSVDPAWISGGSGVLGALAGGFAAGYFTLRGEKKRQAFQRERETARDQRDEEFRRRRETAELQTAARLVLGALYETQGDLRWMIDQKGWRPFVRFSTAAWHQHADTLTSGLGDKAEWVRLIRSFAAIDRLQAKLDFESSAGTRELSFSAEPDFAKAITQLLSEVTAAIAYLDGVADALATHRTNIPLKPVVSAAPRQSD